MQLFKKDKKTNHSASIDYSLVNKLSDEMREILEDELAHGNSISEVYQGKFTKNEVDHIFIFLDKPFKTKIRQDLQNIVYRDINDRHYWKAEYYDIVCNQTIACLFEK